MEHIEAYADFSLFYIVSVVRRPLQYDFLSNLRSNGHNGMLHELPFLALSFL